MKIFAQVAIIAICLVLIATNSPVMRAISSFVRDAETRGVLWGSYTLTVILLALYLWNRTDPAQRAYCPPIYAVTAFAGGIAVALAAVITSLPFSGPITVKGVSMAYVFGVPLGLAAAGIFEELLFRGFVYGIAHRVAGPIAAVVISTAAFAAVHQNAFNDSAHMIFVVAFGLATAVLRLEGASLLELGLFHAGINVVQSGLIGSSGPVQGVARVEPLILALGVIGVAASRSDRVLETLKTLLRS